MQEIPIITSQHWKDYELIDSGNFEKLERFGKYIVARPEPQAYWKKTLSPQKWSERAHAIFEKDKNNSEKGKWKLVKPQATEKWLINYPIKNKNLKFKISLSSFKHVGIFPEQSDNWHFIYNQVQKIGQGAKVLNLFAYTGGASLAANLAGADVTHLDSIKSTLSWARENMENSNLDNIRWIAEDASKFVRREVKRGKIYQGIILDPPAYGRGTNGEKWILEENLGEMLENCAKLLDPQHHFLVINLYSLGFSAVILENLLKSTFKHLSNLKIAELCIEDSFQKKLPLGILGRFYNI